MGTDSKEPKDGGDMASGSSSTLLINFLGASLPVEEYIWYLDTETKEPAGATGDLAKSTRSWVPLMAAESQLLETTYRALLAGDRSRTRVPIHGDLLDADVEGRFAEPVYWSGPHQPLLRASWFVEESSRNWKPLDEAAALEIEEEFQKKPWKSLPPGELCSRRLLSDKSTTALFFSEQEIRIVGGGMTTRLAAAIRGERAASLLLRRGGAAVYPMVMEKVPKRQSTKFRHLIFILHGIGQRLDFNDICVETGWMRTLLNNQASVTHALRFPEESIQILPVQWRKNLVLDCDSPDSTETTIDDVTLTQLSALRNVLNGTMGDILLFMISRVRTQILRLVVQELTRIYNLFVSRNPDFEKNGGQVHFLPHSLGTVVAFELLSPMASVRPLSGPSDTDEMRQLEERLRQLRAERDAEAHRLPFKVTYVFAIGSPLGMFLSVRGLRLTDKPGPRHVMPRVKAWFNIINGYDPVAYRLEPVIAKHLASRKMAYVPWYKGGQKLHIQMQDVGEKLAARFSEFKTVSTDGASRMWSYLSKKAGSLASVATSSSSSSSSLLLAQKSDEEAAASEAVSQHPANHPRAPIAVTEEDVKEADRLLSVIGDGAVDYLLQDEALEAPYVSALLAHFSYWTAPDVAAFILSRLYPTTLATTSQ